MYASKDLVVERGVVVGSHEANRWLACRVQRRLLASVGLYEDCKEKRPPLGRDGLGLGR